MSTRVRVFVPVFLTVLLGGASPAFAGKPVPIPVSITVNGVGFTPHTFASQCRGETNITSNGFKGKAPSVWMLRAGASPVNLGPAVKGVATTYTLPLLPNGETFTPMAFELRDSKGRMLARDEENPTVECLPGLQIISIQAVSYASISPGYCALQITWQPNLLPDGATNEAVIRRISDNPNAFAGIGFVTPSDLGTPRTEPLTGFPAGAIGRAEGSGHYELWIQYMGSDSSITGESNRVGVDAVCPPPT